MIKASLKRIPGLTCANSVLKAALVIRSYRHTASQYAAKLRLTSHELLLARRLEGWRRRRGPKARPRVLFLGTDEQQDRSGFLQALALFAEVIEFSRADGSYGQNDPAPIALRRSRNAERLLELFADLESQNRVPDIVLAQTWAGTIDPRVLGLVRERYGPLVINISMDDRHQFRGERWRGTWTGTYPLIPYLDLALTTAPECAAWYEKEGCPALFFPLASDPDLFRPMPDLPKVHDVCFVGGCYGIRGELVGALRGAGIRVAAYGDGWEGGRIATADVPRLFAQSRIVLGVGTIGHCRDFYALKLRDFDGPMSGTAYLTHDNPDLRGLFEVGAEIATYRNSPDCVEQVRYLLGNNDARESMGIRGRERCLRDHTWERRLHDLFCLLAPAGAGEAGQMTFS